MRILLILILLVACNAQNLTAPDQTPLLWSVAIDGFGTNVLSGDLMVGFGNFYSDLYQSLLAVNIVEKKVSWKIDFKKGISHIFDSQLTANDKAIFAYIPKLGLQVYSTTGELLSQTTPPDSVLNNPNPYSFVPSGPIIHNQFLYLPVANFLFAYDTTNTKQPKFLWERDFGGFLLALTVSSEGEVYVGVSQKNKNDSLQAINPANGQTIWSTHTSITNNSSDGGTPKALTILDEKVIAFVDTSFTIQSFNKKTGERLYISDNLANLCPDGQGFADFIELSDKDIFVSPDGGTCVYGLNGITGQVLWTHSSQIDPNTNFTYGGKPKYLNGIVYASNSVLWALDAKTGKVLSMSSNHDDDALFTNIQSTNGEILVWGKNLTAYKPIR